jgi:hypothetical protein
MAAVLWKDLVFALPLAASVSGGQLAELECTSRFPIENSVASLTGGGIVLRRRTANPQSGESLAVNLVRVLAALRTTTNRSTPAEQEKMAPTKRTSIRPYQPMQSSFQGISNAHSSKIN